MAKTWREGLVEFLDTWVRTGRPAPKSDGWNDMVRAAESYRLLHQVKEDVARVQRHAEMDRVAREVWMKAKADLEAQAAAAPKPTIVDTLRPLLASTAPGHDRPRVTMATYEDCDVMLDEAIWTACNFTRCQMIFTGRFLHMLECTFHDCVWTFDGDAARAVELLRLMWQGGARTMVEGMLDAPGE